MKKYTLSYLACTWFYVLTILSSFSSFGQCPIVTDASPIICDASGLRVSDLSMFAIDDGSGLTWYNMPTGGLMFPPNQLLQEITYYADTASGSCGTRNPVSVDFLVDPSGQNLDGIYCTNDNATIQTYIDEVLAPNSPINGTVEVFLDQELTMMADPTTALVGNDNYYIVFVDENGCRGQIEEGNTAVFDSPLDPIPPSPQVFCSDANPTVGNLNPGTTSDFIWYDAIDFSGNPIDPALTAGTPLIDGETYYVVVSNFICISNPIAVLVDLNDPVDPGVSGVLNYCEDAVPQMPFNLFDTINSNGTASTNGTWSGPIPTTNGFMGTVSIAALTPNTYIFTYIVPGEPSCPDGVATVTITIYENLTSGIESLANPAMFCEMDAPVAFDLFTLLDNEDPGGLWTFGLTSADPVVTSPVDLSSLAPGTYNYTYTQNVLPNPCPEESTTVQVIILEDPHAGNAINATFCESDLQANSPFDLFDALDGTQDNNDGVWTDMLGSIVINPIDISGFIVENSPYEFTYTIDNGTCQDSEIIAITVLESPFAGNALPPFEVCEEDAAQNSPFDLGTLLDGTQDMNGTWSDDDGTGALTGAMVDLTLLGLGTFNFTYTVPTIGTCMEDATTVQIIIIEQPDTGTAIPLILCETDLAANSPLDLFDQLIGEDPGGTFSDDNATGALTGSMVDLTLLTVGTYTFTYSLTTIDGCSNATTITITVEDAAEAGTSTPIQICLVDVAVTPTLDLFTALMGNDAGGTWNDDDATGALFGSIVDLTVLTVGVYNFTYTVTGVGTCPDDFATVQLTINDTAAPSAPSPQEFCDTATVADLIPTGTDIQWYDTAMDTIPLDGTTSLLNGENYFATQTDAITGCESSIRTEVLVIIYTSPQSGTPLNPGLEVCSTETAVDLFDGLTAGTFDTNGTWEDTSTTGALVNNIFDASQVGVGSYQFTYTVTGTPPCTDASTNITVTVLDPVSAGEDTTLAVCSDNGVIDLFSLLPGADVGGTFSPALVSGTTIFDPLEDLDGVYTYTVMNGCNTDASTILITVTLAPDAGQDATITVCRIDGAIDLLTILGGTPDAIGTFSPALASNTSIFDPLIDSAGVYTYAVNAQLPCTSNASATVTIIINDSDAVLLIEDTAQFCASEMPTIADLDSYVIGEAIQWYIAIDAVTPLSSTTSLIDGTTYYATQTENNGCESSIRAALQVIVNSVETPIIDPLAADLCAIDNPTLQVLSLEITQFDAESMNVLWYDAAVDGNTLPASTLLTNNTTYYAVLIDMESMCESEERLPVTVDLTICERINLPDGFSPNGDGVNDSYIITNLDVVYPNFELEIYNRNGNLVYIGNAATTPFNGISNQSNAVSNDDLPVGVYFYILKYNNDIGTQPVQGRLYLSR
jgi:gliding motility-associated-like protein